MSVHFVNNGNIVVDVTDDYKFELATEGFSLISQTECPIEILSGDKVTISAKKGTENYVYDIRDEVSDTDETAISASVYSLCDLDIQGKGSLYVTSLNNNGIHTKDDLKVKNLFLQVDCKDNALKGNDSVTIQSGEIVLIARNGDGIKTSNSDLSSKGKQRGTVAVSGGDINVVGSYEGLEGAVVTVSGGNVSVISSDDGLNGTGTSGNSIVISGGTLYVLAGGDGLDSNSTDSYGGIVFKGGKIVVIAYGNADSSIDTERGYSYEGGYVLAVGKSGGMSGEATNSSPSISSIGKTANVSLSNGAYLLASGFACVKMPISINASVVVLGDTSASISSVSSADYEFDSNGVCWLK